MQLFCKGESASHKFLERGGIPVCATEEREAEPVRGEGGHDCYCYHHDHDFRKLSTSSTIINRTDIAMHVRFPAKHTVKVDMGFSANRRASCRWVGDTDGMRAPSGNTSGN